MYKNGSGTLRSPVFSLLGTTRNESSREHSDPGAKVLRNFRSWERRFPLGTFAHRNENTRGAKSPDTHKNRGGEVAGIHREDAASWNLGLPTFGSSFPGHRMMTRDIRSTKAYLNSQNWLVCALI